MEINTDKAKTLVVGNQLNDCIYQVYICVGARNDEVYSVFEPDAAKP
jgi:hypothetical protein